MPILKTVAAAVAATALLLGAAAASATPVVLDVDGAPAGHGFGSLVEDGYRVTGSGTHYVSLGGARYCGPACPDNGTNNLLGQQGASFTVAAVDGSAFALSAFDGGEAHMGQHSLWARQIRVTGTQVGGATVVSDFTLDWFNDGGGAGADFQRFVLGTDFSNLSSVQFTGVGGTHNWFTLDNIGLNEPVQLAAALPAAAAVPEPGSLLLAGLALAGLVAARRRPAAH